MNLQRTLAVTALVAMAAFAFAAPPAGATLVDRMVFAEEFGFST